jgi:hypothetical protein
MSIRILRNDWGKQLQIPQLLNDAVLQSNEQQSTFLSDF